MDEKILRKIGYGLYVLTANEDGRDNGCIINTFMQVTGQPPRVSAAVNKGNYTHDLIMRTGCFNVSIISQEADFQLFKRFGFASGRDTDKFAGFDKTVRCENGILAVTEGCCGFVSAKVFQTVDLGTHTMFLADMTGGGDFGGAEPATYAYYHSNIKPGPQQAKSGGWRCRICGYVYEGEELPPDFVCPICKHGAADFERV